MNTFELSLDLDKSVGVKQWITLRQGDKRGTTLQATLYDHGVLVSGSYTCRVSIRHPNRNTYYRETATYSNGVATVTIDETSAASVVGVTEGYFELLQGSTLIASTESFGVRVLQSATDGATVGPPYDSAIQDALDELDAATGRISQMVVDATAEYLAAHPEITTTVQDNSVTDAKLIQSGGVLDRVGRLWWRLENLLTNTPAESDVLTVTDAAKTPLAGLALYGRSTQDGTPTPSAPVAIQSVTPNLAKGYAATATNNGITYVTTEGGATTISGTASGVSAMPLQTAGTFELPAGTYTLVMGGELTASGTGARAQLVKVVGSSISNVNATPYTTNGGTVYVTFTTTEDMTAFVRIGVNSGSVVSGTLQFALYEGSVAYPAVPYGYAGLLARGKNLLPPNVFTSASGFYSDGGNGAISVIAADNRLWGGIPSFPLGAGTYTFHRSNASGRVTINIYDADGNALPQQSLLNGESTLTFTAPSNTSYAKIKVGYSASSYPFTTTVQLELGSTATAYQPYESTVTPIPFNGHELRSLPDGTRDEVTVDQYGHVTLVQRTGYVSADTLESASKTVIELADVVRISYANVLKDEPSRSYNGDPAGSGWCNVAPYENNYTQNAVHVYAHNAYAYVFAPKADKSTWDATTATEWTNEHAPELVYALATPVTIDLGTIDPTALVGPDMTAQAVPTAPFALTYERDLNATLARLEAAIAEVATS